MTGTKTVFVLQQSPQEGADRLHARNDFKLNELECDEETAALEKFSIFDSF